MYCPSSTPSAVRLPPAFRACPSVRLRPDTNLAIEEEGNAFVLISDLCRTRQGRHFPAAQAARPKTEVQTGEIETGQLDHSSRMRAGLCSHQILRLLLLTCGNLPSCCLLSSPHTIDSQPANSRPGSILRPTPRLQSLASLMLNS